MGPIVPEERFSGGAVAPGALGLPLEVTLGQRGHKKATKGHERALAIPGHPWPSLAFFPLVNLHGSQNMSPRISENLKILKAPEPFHSLALSK